VLSARTRFDLAPNRLSRALAERTAAGGEVLDLTLSNPTLAGFDLPAAAIRTAVSDPEVLCYRPDPRGGLPARQAVSAYYAARGGAVDPEAVVLCASTSEAYSFLFKLLCDPGDRVLVPRPSYPLFEYLAGLESVSVVGYPLTYDGQWRIDLDELRAACVHDPRAIVVVSPNNPTGSFLRADELAALRALGRPIICDEVFSDYGSTSDAACVRTVATERELLCFALSGLSKVAGLPQLKLGWIAVAGPEAARQEALARLELVGDTFLSVSAPAQAAACRLLPQVAGFQEQVRARVAHNRAALARALGDTSPAQILAADGGWYACIRLPRTRSEEDWVLTLLERDGVLVHPGYFFDFLDEAYVVASLLAVPAQFARAAERLARRVAGDG
jgi:aspartate/methionine/tyrosine aminotransferase